MYSMPSERITSTMKSEPGLPGDVGSAAGTSVSAAWAAAEGNFTAGAAAAACGAATVEAAPAPATPARNLRRSTFIVSMRAFLCRGLEHDPEKACPGLDPGWVSVFGKDHAPRSPRPLREWSGCRMLRSLRVARQGGRR